MQTAANTKKRLYLDTLGITVYTDKNSPCSFMPSDMADKNTSIESTELPVVTDSPISEVAALETTSLKTTQTNNANVEQQNILTAPLDVALVQNNYGVAVVADLTDFAEVENNWNSTQEFLLDIARATTITLFGENCDLSKAKAQRIHGAMSVAGQLKTDKASADFLHGALLGPKNESPKMIVMLGHNAIFFTEFGEGRELFSQRLSGESLQTLINSVQAKQALWQAIKSYVLGG